MDETERSIFDLINSASDRTAAFEIAVKLALEILKPREEPRDTLPSYPAASA